MALHSPYYVLDYQLRAMHANATKILFPVLLAALAAGCARLPYDRTTETSVAGAAAGAAAGAVLAGDEDEVLGAVIGGLLGAAGGYVIGAETGWFGNGNDEEFDQTVNDALADPATAEDVYGSDDADLNNDGLVTQDEIIALSNAGLSEAQVINRLQATDQRFYVNYEQRQELIEAGVDPDVVYELEEINRPT